MLTWEFGHRVRAVNLLEEALHVITEAEVSNLLGASYILGDLGFLQASINHLRTEGLSNLRQSDEVICAYLPTNHVRVTTSKRMLAHAVAGSGHLRESENIELKAISNARAAGSGSEQQWLQDDLARVRSARKRSREIRGLAAEQDGV
jgi:hypothetical protein